MGRLVLSSLRAQRRRLVGTAASIVLGVAFLVGTLVLGDTIAASFDRLFRETAAGTDVVVRNATDVGDDVDLGGGRGPLDADLVATVAGVDGVRAAVGQVTGYGQLLGADGRPVGGNGPPRQAGSWVDDPGLNPYRLVEGRAPEAPDEVLVNRGAAEAGSLVVGSRTVVQTPQPVPVTVVGLATFGDADGLGETTFAAFTLAAAQEHVLGRGDAVSSILVAGDDGVGAAELAARVQEALPGGVEAVTGDQLVDERLEQLGFLGVLRALLVVFAAIALVVAVISIANTGSITVAQRSRELSVLRAVGASRRQVRRLVTSEALAVGAVSSAVGVLAGLGVAALLKALFAGLGFAFPADGLAIRLLSVLAGLVVGVVATFVASRRPARRASATSPLAAVRAGATEAELPGRRRLLVGSALGVVGVALVLLGVRGTLRLEGPGAVLLLAAVLGLAPVGVRPVSALAGRVLGATRGLPGRLAADGAARHPRRTASAATGLVMGVAVVSLFTVFAASLQADLEGRVEAGFGRADLAIATPVFGGGLLSPRAAEEVAALPLVSRSVAVGSGFARVDGSDDAVTVADPAAAGEVLAVDVVDGSLPGGAAAAGTLAVSEGRAAARGWSVGTPVTATFADGATEALVVTAVYAEHAVLGDAVVDRATWDHHATQPTDRAVFATLAPGASADEARAAFDDVARRYSGEVQTRAEFAAAATNGLDLLRNVVYALLALSILIAVLSLANTLSLVVHERRREIGQLRAVGQTRRAARSTLRLESVIIAVYGTTVGLVLGAFLGWGLFTATNGGSASLPVVPLAVVLAGGALAGVLAAVRPARRAARLPILDALAAS